MKELEATLKNLTPHSINIPLENGEIWRIPAPPLTEVARVAEHRIALGYVLDGTKRVRINRKVWDRNGATGIPPKDGRLYIVSTVVAEAFPERDDFLVPDEMERGPDGQVMLAKALAQMWPAAAQVAKEYIDKARDYTANVLGPAATRSGIGDG